MGDIFEDILLQRSPGYHAKSGFDWNTVRVDGEIFESERKTCGFKNIRTRVDRASVSFTLTPQFLFQTLETVIQTPRISTKRLFSFQLSSWCLDVPMKHLHTFLPLFSNIFFFYKLDMPTGSQLIQVGHVLTKKKKVRIEVNRNQEINQREYVYKFTEIKKSGS